jgi:hypothetical protein
MLLHACRTNKRKFQRFIWIVLDGFTLFLSTDLSCQFNDLLPSHGECQIDILSVGDLGGLFDQYSNPFAGAKRLLYSQNTMPKVISRLHAMSPLSRSCQYHYLPRTLYLSGDFIKNPISVTQYSSSDPHIIFAGQDGRFSAIHAFHNLGMDHALEEFQDLLDQIDRGQGHLNELILFSVTAIKQATQYHNEKSLKNAACNYILANSLSRLVILRHLVPMPWFHLVPYPSSYLNICSWPQIGNYHVLDLGGINGSEYYYPRSVDLAINRIKTIKLEPVHHNQFFNSTDSVHHYSRKQTAMVADMLFR